jgi:hypothetical protein
MLFGRAAPESPVAVRESSADTIIDVIDEPAPGVIRVTEYESIRTVTPISSGREPKRRAGPETDEQ